MDDFLRPYFIEIVIGCIIGCTIVGHFFIWMIINRLDKIIELLNK